MTTRTRTRTIALVAAGAIVILVAIGYLLLGVFGGSVPAEVALSSVSAGVTASGDPGEAAGTWVVDAASGSLADGTSSFAGYRIEEQLSGVGAHEAVGRTQSVTGTMTVSDTQVTTLDVTVEMTTLQSDDDRRDAQLRQRGLETDSFPTATFTLTEPIEVGKTPKVGATVDATAVGQLTLHGVTQQVSVPVQARWTGERIEVAGSLDVALADHQIEPPVGFLVLSIADHGTIEFHLLFTRA